MTLTILITETYPINNIPPNIVLFDFLILKYNPKTEGKITTPDNADVVSWDTLSRQKLNMDPNIASLTRTYCDEFKHTIHLT